MAFDAHNNLAYSTVAVAPSPPLSGTSLTLAAGQGALMPAAPFNCTVWAAGVMPLTTNAEIVRVTAVVGDVLTIVRAQESTSARSITLGDQFANTATVKVFTDIETAINGKQPLAANLTSLAALTWASLAFVKMTAAGTFALDTNTYLTANQAITLTGDVTGSGATSIATTIAAAAVTLGKMANLAANSIIGNNTGSPATPLALTVAQAKALLAIAQADVAGLTVGSSPTFAALTLSTGNLTFSANTEGVIFKSFSDAGNQPEIYSGADNTLIFRGGTAGWKVDNHAETATTFSCTDTGVLKFGGTDATSFGNFLCYGATKGIAFFITSTKATIQAVDNTGLSTYQPLWLNGSTVDMAISATSVGQFTITGLNNCAIGATTPSTGAFTTLSATGLFSATQSLAGVVRHSFRNTSSSASAFCEIDVGNDTSATQGYFGVIGSAGSAYGGADSVYLGTAAAKPVTIISSNAVVGSFTSTGLAVTGNISSTGVVVLKNYTVATLPAAASFPYGTAFVTDATLGIAAGLGLTPIGGGANTVPVYSDGANWKIG